MRSYSAGLYRLVGILILVDLLGATTCGSGVGNVTGTEFGGIQIASGLIFTGSDGLLGGVMKVGDSGGDIGALDGSLNCGGGVDGGLGAGVITKSGIGLGLTTG